MCLSPWEIITRKRLQWRWLATLLFGLIHGFGFSYILQGMLIRPAYRKVHWYASYAYIRRYEGGYGAIAGHGEEEQHAGIRLPIKPIKQTPRTTA
ncbi:HupE/UreJ family protein [Paenibacillus solisilvae]|uniref:HupE/UreJ family protein n=1 Tax=Paenibacillus solisilvae TaxID=2486751 RepID=A0ABW0VZT0_9BACL